IEVRVAGEARWAAVEDAGRLRDALGSPLPTGIPEAFTEPVADPLGDLVSRYARCHGPFTALAVAARYGLGVAVVAGALRRLAAAGRIAEGEFLAGGRGTEWCDTEVLRLLRRRGLARLRKEAEPVPPRALAAFRPAWQEAGQPIAGRGPGRARRAGPDAVYEVIEQLAGAALPASALETLVLPGRVPGYEPAMLDELTAAGEVAWSGAGALPGGDGWVVIGPASSVPLLFPPPGDITMTPLHEAILAALDGGGALFFRALADRADQAARAASQAGTNGTGVTGGPGAANGTGENGRASGPNGAVSLGDAVSPGSTGSLGSPGSTGSSPGGTGSPGSTGDAAVAAAIWDLVWAGLLTNDTLAPLRTVLGAGRPAAPKLTPGRAGGGPATRRGRLGQRRPGLSRAALPSRSGPPTVTGRWSLLPRGEADQTRRLHALARVLLDRHGILIRGAAAAERVAGGFGALYPVLRAMEEAGQCRRGYFVEGLGAAQFALPGAVDRMRAIAQPSASGDTTPAPAVVLAATDPASAYGAALPWPSRPDETPGSHRPGRKAGALVVLSGGDLVLYVERGGRTLLSWTSDPAELGPAAAALADAVHAGALGRLTVERADGATVYDSPLAQALEAAGFRPTPRGLRLLR
ncbi:MAG: DEAD/DEAH box helicase, partial [Actinomycetota bacterium]